MRDMENREEKMNEMVDPKDKFKIREMVHKLIISQLFYDGYQQIAAQLIGLTQPDIPCPPSDRLVHLISLGLEQEQKLEGAKLTSSVNKGGVWGPGLDLERENERSGNAPEPALYETVYVTAHKAPCRAGAINSDGTLVATASVDTSIKILSVERMLAKSGESESGEGGGHPVVRTLYDHVEEVTALAFHPRDQILFSASRDFTLRLFDFSRTSVKKAFRVINESEAVLSMSIHPTGDYLLVGTAAPVIRLYDINTSQSFVPSEVGGNHRAEISTIAWSSDGRLYVSGSTDGAIKIWDGVSNRCINTCHAAHDGTPIGSVAFTKNNKYILSSGRDSLVKLWELSTNRCLIAYTGAGATGKQEHSAQAVFNHTEDFVLYPDEATISLCSWEARTAQRQNLLSLGHNGPIRYIVHSPNSPGFLTCSDDFRARYWYRRVSSI